ncbi:protease modulator HflC [Salinispira pacifica]
MKKLVVTLIVIGVVLILFLALGPFYIVQEGEQAVVIRFGQIISSTDKAGLHLKSPAVDNVVTYSNKVLSWDGDPSLIPTAENQFIWVDATARWRISDPVMFYGRLTTMTQAYSRLDDIIESTIKTVISRSPLREAVRNTNIINDIKRSILPTDAQGQDLEGIEELASLTTTQQQQPEVAKGRRALSNEMLAAAKEITPEFGIAIIDIVIRQIRYSDELTESVYNRMVAERKQIAEASRSYGQGRKQRWLGQMENEKRAILSEAYATSEEIRGQADAQAAKTYSAAYRQSPRFFEFWRAMESYRKTLPQFSKTLSTDMDYFRFLYSPTGR